MWWSKNSIKIWLSEKVWTPSWKKKSQNKMSENNNFVHFCKVFVILYDSTQKASNVIKVSTYTFIPGLGVDLVIKKLYVI